MKIRPDMKDHSMAIAAREINSYAETHGLDQVCESLGLKLEDVIYMAEQRALRVLYARHGININATKPLELELKPEDMKLMTSVIIPAYMDGLVIGWRAQQIEQENKNEHAG